MQMKPDPLRVLALENIDVHDEAAIEAAVAEVPPPRSPDRLVEMLYALGVSKDHLVIDLGCGHGQYARQITAATGCRVIALDLSRERVAETLSSLAASERTRTIVAAGVAEALPLRPASVDFIWCRDMLNHVDLRTTLRGCAAVLRPGGHMVVYQSFATDLLDLRESQRLCAAFAIVPANMARDYWEAAAAEAGFAVVERDEIGSEWREWWEQEGSQRVTSANLQRAARLIRGAARLKERLGETAYEFALADQLWGIYQMIGKLCPTAYVLRLR